MEITINHHVYIHDGPPGRLEHILLEILKLGKRMANDLTGLDAKLDELSAKADKADADLAALAQEVADLKGTPPADLQPAIDALTAKAQGILDRLSAADDAVQPQLPPAP